MATLLASGCCRGLAMMAPFCSRGHSPEQPDVKQPSALVKTLGVYTLGTRCDCDGAHHVAMRDPTNGGCHGRRRLVYPEQMEGDGA